MSVSYSIMGADFMKKLLICLLVLLLLTGCGAQTVTPATTAPEEMTTIPEETTIVTEEETTTEATLPPVEGVEGKTLYNEDKFALVFQGLAEAQLPENATKKQKAAFVEGTAMTVTAINRTDMTVYMRLMNLSVNSYMFETLPTVALEPGEHRQVQYTLPKTELWNNGITEIHDLQFNLWVYDSEDFKTPDVADGLCIYYVNEPVYPERKSLETDQVLVENERYSVVITSVTVGENVELQLHLQNFSDKELLFIAPYGTINGNVVDPLWAYNVSGGKQRNSTMTFPLTSLEGAELTELVVAVQIGDHQDWSLGAYFYKAFSIRLGIEQEPVEELPVEESTEETTAQS